MRTTKLLILILAASIFTASCSSTTNIQSNPKGAKLYMNDQLVGTTPYIYTDTKIVGTCTNIRLEKEGYEIFNTQLCRNEEADAGAIVGGIFLLIPFLWTMKYHPMHIYELTPLGYTPVEATPSKNIEPSKKGDQLKTTPLKSKTERLREMKELLDEGVLTKEEYDVEKQKILDEQ